MVQIKVMAEIENRYKALIQPIKDIAANWDIDIAESLTEYLEDLDNLRISIDGGKSNLNFAEAALLIQGSTAVYSKKVEYLHQLVLQSLEFITNKKSTAGAGAQGGKITKTADDDDILFLDNDASFLLLDHIVEEGHNINLKTTAPNLADRRNSRNSVSCAVRADTIKERIYLPIYASILSQNSFASENNTSRVSMSLMHSILSDDQGSASLKLVSFLLKHEQAVFILFYIFSQSTSLVDGSGALLLCGSYPTASTGARFQPSSSDRSSLQNSFHATSFQAESAAQAQDMDMYGDDGGGDWGGGDDDYDGYNGHDDPVADPFPYADTSAPMTLGTPAKAPQPTSAVAAPVATSSSSSSSGTVKRRAAPSKDMFAQLDPHQAQTNSREARRGKTYKLPLSLTKPPQNMAERGLDHLYADMKVTNTAAFLSTGAVPSKGLFDTSLLPILQLKRKQIRQARLAVIRANHAAGVVPQATTQDGDRDGDLNEPVQYQNLHLSLGQANISAIANTSRVEELWSQDYADDGDFGGDYGGGDDYDGPDDHAAGDRNAFGATVGDVLNAAAEAGGDHFGGGGADWAEESEEEALARRVANVLNEELNQSTRGSYESICQKYIDNFNQGAHLFAK